jgi:ABC-2 type transport system permease protein
MAQNNLIGLMMFGLLGLQALFMSIGAFFAGILKNPKLSSVAATSVLLGTYIISVVVDLNSNLANLKYLTPFKYFDPKTMIDTGGINLWYVLLTLVLILLFVLGTYVFYNKRDLKV